MKNFAVGDIIRYSYGRGPVLFKVYRITKEHAYRVYIQDMNDATRSVLVYPQTEHVELDIEFKLRMARFNHLMRRSAQAEVLIKSIVITEEP